MQRHKQMRGFLKKNLKEEKKKRKKLWSRCFLDTFKHLGCESNLQVFCPIYWAFLLLMCLLWEIYRERKEQTLLDDPQNHTVGISNRAQVF